jgi:TRAP-type C4-dicarboxylate transport system permease small subunit
MERFLKIVVMLEAAVGIMWFGYETVTGNIIAIHPIDGIEILRYTGIHFTRTSANWLWLLQPIMLVVALLFARHREEKHGY